MGASEGTQAGETWKKHVPLHKQGNVCPNGVHALPEKGTSNDNKGGTGTCILFEICEKSFRNVWTRGGAVAHIFQI